MTLWTAAMASSSSPVSHVVILFANAIRGGAEESARLGTDSSGQRPSGSFSLKSVLPSLVPELGYDDLEIGDGGAASLAYAEMQATGTTRKRWAELRAELLAYCKRDTEGLLKLFRLFQ